MSEKMEKCCLFFVLDVFCQIFFRFDLYAGHKTQVKNEHISAYKCVLDHMKLNVSYKKVIILEHCFGFFFTILTYTRVDLYASTYGR